MQGFETVRQELDAKRQLLEQELQSAQGKVAEIRADLERVQEALEALIGPKKKAKGRSRSRKPTATVQDLQRHIARVRAEHPYASAHELRKAVRALVRESGTSVTRFPTLFAEALVSSPGFSGSTEPGTSFIPLSHARPEVHSEASPHPDPHALGSHGDEDAPHVHEAHEAEPAGDTPPAQGEEDFFSA
jgi:hypothetical protein